MQPSKEQQLIDIMYQIAMTSAQYLHGKSNEEIAEWVSIQLGNCGFDTEPCCASWGVLK
jgi:hypothetical protein